MMGDVVVAREDVEVVMEHFWGYELFWVISRIAAQNYHWINVVR